MQYLGFPSSSPCFSLDSSWFFSQTILIAPLSFAFQTNQTCTENPAAGRTPHTRLSRRATRRPRRPRRPRRLHAAAFRAIHRLGIGPQCPAVASSRRPGRGHRLDEKGRWPVHGRGRLEFFWEGSSPVISMFMSFCCSCHRFFSGDTAVHLWCGCLEQRCLNMVVLTRGPLIGPFHTLAAIKPSNSSINSTCRGLRLRGNCSRKWRTIFLRCRIGQQDMRSC